VEVALVIVPLVTFTDEIWKLGAYKLVIVALVIVAEVFCKLVTFTFVPFILVATKLVDVALVIVASVAVKAVIIAFAILAKVDTAKLVDVALVIVPLVATKFVVVKFVNIAVIAFNNVANRLVELALVIVPFVNTPFTPVTVPVALMFVTARSFVTVALLIVATGTDKPEMFRLEIFAVPIFAVLIVDDAAVVVEKVEVPDTDKVDMKLAVPVAVKFPVARLVVVAFPVVAFPETESAFMKNCPAAVKRAWVPT
jgi:hypothetical protein